jgi:hypothetical protein
MKRLWIAGIGALVMAVVAANAGEKAKDKPDAKADAEIAAAPAVEMTLTGTVEKVEKKKKDGTPFMTWFELAGDDGVITHLPKGKVEDFVAMKVRVVGTGTETTKGEKTTRKLETITSIEKVETTAKRAK